MHFKIDAWILKENDTELFYLGDLLKQSHKSTFPLPKTLFIMTIKSIPSHVSQPLLGSGQTQ